MICKSIVTFQVLEVEDENDWSEETIFCLVPKKTEQLTNVYHQQNCDKFQPTSDLQKIPSVMCSGCYTFSAKAIPTQLNKWSLSSLCTECYDCCKRKSVISSVVRNIIHPTF